MSENHELTIYTDGGSRGNPGPAAYAYVIQRAGLADIEEKAYLGRTTNNIAEYTGLVKALEHARHLGAQRLTVFSDSELMVKQLNGEYRVKNEGLRPLYEQAVALRRDFASVNIQHVRRAHNKHADRLCNEAMDHPADNQPLPVPLPPLAKPALPPAATAAIAPVPVAAPADPQERVRSAAIELLAESAREWAEGDATIPAPAEVWSDLWRLLVKAKVVHKPKKPGSS
jgi:ribonuclease HI